MERAGISELYCKKAPRIISRGRLRPANTSAKKEKECVKNDYEVDDEVGEDFVVRGGVMMKIADVNKEQWKSMKRFYIDVNRSQIYQHAEAHDRISLGDEANSSRVTVEVSALPGDGRMFHICDNLPGIANEVESYPCRHCPNRIFLTSFGLERHTKIEHKTHLPEVLEEISRIRNEWKRRETFKAIAKKRREALKKTRMLTEIVKRSQSLRSEHHSANRHYTGALSCHICGLSFEANCEFMMNHFRAHRKNDDLRRRLLANFGPSYVARCTCYQCHLVFVNEKNLMLHKESSHLRKRKYVCKWCGDVCLSVNELNEHKKDVHGVPCSRTEKLPTTSTISNSQKNTAKLNDIVADDSLAEKQTLCGNGFADTSSGNRTSMLDQSPCIAKCSECGLTTVKPSLLIRHMQRVHNKNCFSTVIEVKGLPNIRVDMDRGKVTWWCCDFSFEDRYRFIHHRKTCHQQMLEHGHLQNCAVSAEEQATMHETNDRECMSTAQIVQLINQDEIEDDELYVFMAEEDLEQEGEIMLREMRTSESMVEGAQTVRAKEFLQLRQQIGENFDRGMQIVLVDVVNDAQRQSPNSGAEPAIDFIANNVVDNDVLNSLLISSTQMPSTDYKYYSRTQSTESDFSVVNVPDSTEDKILHNDLPLPSESLINVETRSSPTPTATFSRDPRGTLTTAAQLRHWLRHPLYSIYQHGMIPFRLKLVKIPIQLLQEYIIQQYIIFH
ncbi:Zinc finger, C2H2 type family protein [Brugia malayi]|uniref:Zinc finger, C2H2 type family protein n=1 Tax=Brugia malayi TaxID=6279 RepID=A0A4E9FBK4_BRUMA|nr:Zinc finger, C2H2 type family protein [Brugia malayi]VIO93514.1 Zinc finger, C2H2 type family protein [Brugia malayi]